MSVYKHSIIYTIPGKTLHSFIPRHQGIDSGFRVFGEALRQYGQQVADVFFRIKAVGLRRFHDRINRGAGLYAFDASFCVAVSEMIAK